MVDPVILLDFAVRVSSPRKPAVHVRAAVPVLLIVKFGVAVCPWVSELLIVVGLTAIAACGTALVAMLKRTLGRYVVAVNELGNEESLCACLILVVEELYFHNGYPDERKDWFPFSTNIDRLLLPSYTNGVCKVTSIQPLVTVLGNAPLYTCV